MSPTAGRRASRIRTVFTVSFLAIAIPATADVSEDVRSLPFHRAIQLDARHHEGFVEVWEDDTLAARARTDFGDVRVVNATGEVVPIVFREPRLLDEVLLPWIQRPVSWVRGEGGVSTFEVTIETIPKEELVARLAALAAESSVEFQASEHGTVCGSLRASPTDRCLCNARRRPALDALRPRAASPPSPPPRHAR
jgi:hypothetical protein